jgi:hypothetical protein
MTFSIITPSFGQLDWLRLCVASVRDQAVGEKAETLKTEKLKEVFQKTEAPKTEISVSQHFRFSDFSVEHIIQDAGSPGIEEFAREVGAAFYRNGTLVFSEINGHAEPDPAEDSKFKIMLPPFHLLRERSRHV